MNHLLHDELARTHITGRLDEAQALRRGRRVVHARRMARRAERAAMQARLVLARSL